MTTNKTKGSRASQRAFRLGPYQQAWVESLRTGGFGQTYGLLCEVADDGKYHCCLGVACEVAIVNGLPLTPEEGIVAADAPDRGVGRDGGSCITGTAYVHYADKFIAGDGSTHDEYALPPLVSDLLCFRSAEGHLSHTQQSFKEFPYNSLLLANDSRKVTFQQIADFVEKYPQVVFSKPA